MGLLIVYKDRQALRDWYFGGLGNVFRTRTRRTLGLEAERDSRGSEEFVMAIVSILKTAVLQQRD